MAWIEQRYRKYVPYERLENRKVSGPRFDTHDEAALFLRLVDLAGWQAACDYVASTAPHEPATHPAPPTLRERAIAAGAIDDPKALPVNDPNAPVPEGIRLAGVSVGELVRIHISSISTRDRTREQYRSYVRDHVDPFFEDLDAGRVIRTDHPAAQGTGVKTVTAWREALLATPGRTRQGRLTGRTLQRKTVKNVMSLVATAYAEAMTADFAPLVDRNPFTKMSPKQTAPDDVERIYLSPEQFRAVLEHTIEHYQPFLLFLGLTGLRWGEGAGLRARDVHLSPDRERPFFEVRTALRRPRGGGVMFGWLKSRAARRRLTIPDALIPIIEQAADGKGPDDPVFTAPRGGALHHGNVSRNLAKAIARAQAAGHDIPAFSLHALRHTCAAWLLSAGRTPYQVSRQLGHETEATTM